MMNRMPVGIFVFVLSLPLGCALLSESDKPAESGAAGSRKKMVSCELEPGTAPFVFMPHGKYKGTYPDGSATLDLMEDGKFHLYYVNRYTKEEKQWMGKFAWKKQGIGEVLNLCGVRSGSAERVDPMTRDISSAVMGFDQQESKFRVSLDGIGETEFVLAK